MYSDPFAVDMHNDVFPVNRILIYRKAGDASFYPRRLLAAQVVEHPIGRPAFRSLCGGRFVCILPHTKSDHDQKASDGKVISQLDKPEVDESDEPGDAAELQTLRRTRGGCR